MKVCLVADEFFRWGFYGGYGMFSMKLGTELVKRGVEVDAVVQKISQMQKPVGEVESVHGVNVKTLPRNKIAKLTSDLYKTDADVIHSQCGRLDTYFAFRYNKTAKKVVTVQDLRTKADLEMLGNCERKNFVKRVWSSYVDKLYRKALNEANVVACQAELLKPKIREVYDFENVRLLRNFVDVPDEKQLEKSSWPSVVWLGRLDKIKRPQLCFELAKRMRNVQFYILGKSSSEEYQWNPNFRDIQNLHWMGFDNGKVKERLLSAAWILINTSLYECLPVSFLEAMAHKCALLSTQNPDDYTKNFGVHARSPSELEFCLKSLIYADNWKRLGQKGYEYVREHHETNKCVQEHIDLYQSLIDDVPLGCEVRNGLNE